MSESVLPPSRNGSVVLDIGGDVGALVLHVSFEWDEGEIEIEADEPQGFRTHSAVRARTNGPEQSFAAVYPSLAAGWYRIVDTGQRFHVVGGRVSEVTYDPN